MMGSHIIRDYVDIIIPHDKAKDASSYVQGDSHEELDALVTDFVQHGDFLEETASVIPAPCFPGDYLDTAMPVATVVLCVCAGEGGEGGRGGGEMKKEIEWRRVKEKIGKRE